jgi:hypothetical protein
MESATSMTVWVCVLVLKINAPRDGSTHQKIHAMTTMSAVVWVKLVIDGDDSYEASRITITSEMNLVDDLKVAIVNQTPELRSRFIGPASLKVYPPGTRVPVPEEGAESIPPYLPLGISGPTPLIVTAKSTTQQVSLVFSLLLLAVAVPIAS